MLSKSNLNTSDPIALRFLMSETIFVSAERNAEVAMDHVQEPPNQPNEEALTFTFYGENKRNCLFLTNEQQHEFMSDEALDAFIKTLSALNMTSADIAVFNLGAGPAIPQQTDVISFFKPRTMVFLGVDPEIIGLAAMSAQTVAEFNGMTLFNTCTFDEMIADARRKRLFWTMIKTLLA